jgi:hypothetical protein
MHMPDESASFVQQPLPASLAGALIWRLGLSHLFLWMTLYAIVLAANRFLFFPGSGSLGSSAWVILESIEGGITLTIVVLWLVRCIKSGARTLWPGEWLLLLSGIRDIGFLCLVAAFPGALEAIRLAYFLVFTICAIPAVRVNIPRRWRIFFCLVVAVNVPLGVAMVMLPLDEAWYAYWELTLITCLMSIVVADRRSPDRWPFSHWLGPLVWIWSSTLHLTGYAMRMHFGF